MHKKKEVASATGQLEEIAIDKMTDMPTNTQPGTGRIYCTGNTYAWICSSYSPRSHCIRKKYKVFDRIVIWRHVYNSAPYLVEFHSVLFVTARLESEARVVKMIVSDTSLSLRFLPVYGVLSLVHHFQKILRPKFLSSLSNTLKSQSLMRSSKYLQYGIPKV